MSSVLNRTLLVMSILAIVPACKGKETPKADPAAKADPATATKPAEKPVPVNAGPSPSKDKEMLGLELAPMGDWKPTWDADAKVAKWENESYMTGIVIRIVSDKLDSIDDLKEAAPMMMQLGTAVTKVVEQGTTPKGWWAIVDTNDGKSTNMVYVQKFATSQLVCSGNLTPRKDATSAGGIKKEEVLTACESIKVKS
jgi:hypothetical protein